MKLSLEQDLHVRDLFEAGDVDKLLEWVARKIKEGIQYELEDQEAALSIEFERGRLIGAEEMQTLADRKFEELEELAKDRENYWKMNLEECEEVAWEKGFDLGYQKALERLLEPNDDALNTAYASGYVDGQGKDCPNG